MNDTIKLYQQHTMTLNTHFFSYFVAVIFLTMSHSSIAELEIADPSIAARERKKWKKMFFNQAQIWQGGTL